MIISASRRTDIPAFYSEWFINRIREGFVDVRNPMNPSWISRVPLNKELVDCIVFWTKNADPMVERLSIIDAMGYAYYFQFTLTPYDHSIEKNLVDKSEIITGFKKLSDKIGPHRVVWRYDPVIINNSLTVEYHLHSFEKLCRILYSYTSRCIFSYVDLYKKIRKRTKSIISSEIDTETMEVIARGFSEIAQDSGIILETCSEQIDLLKYGIQHASCINQKMIEEITGYRIATKKDSNQRQHCNCIESLDIGAYNSCAHGCVYCYASSNENLIKDNMQQHDINSSLLIGKPEPAEKINTRTVKSLRDIQPSLPI